MRRGWGRATNLSSNSSERISSPGSGDEKDVGDNGDVDEGLGETNKISLEQLREDLQSRIR